MNMKKNETYNGWSNYVTWRVNLELFDGGEWQGYTPEEMRDYVEEIVDIGGVGIARDYAMAFLEDVNWQEIAEHYNEEQ